MNYRLSIHDGTYDLQDLHIPSAATMANHPDGQPFSFVSPIRLAVGQNCVLLGDAVGYRLQVNSCAGFTYSVRYLVSGTIETKEAMSTVAS